MTNSEPGNHELGNAALDVAPEHRPRHIAIIMDGNGRWAVERGMPRMLGHREGARAVRSTIEECARLEIGALTLYSFSSENWKRPAEEIAALMNLLLEYLGREVETMLREGIRFRHIGRRDRLPDNVVAAIESAERATAHGTGLQLSLAVDYGSRAEIVDATRAIALKVRDEGLDPNSIDEAMMEEHLLTQDLPDPDLLIRSAGEYRLSNFLLWQISYAELHVTDVLWPTFREADLHAAIRDFAARHRRYGGLERV